MNQLIYNYPRNYPLLEAYHGYYKQHPTWEPQGDRLIKKGGRSTINIEGVEYYKPRSYVAIPYHHMNVKPIKTMENMEGGISFSDVKKKVGKTVAKKALSVALDQIPKGTAVVGTTLGALAGELLGPEAIPVTAFMGKVVGKQVGKLARNKIKEKTGYGIYKELAKARAKTRKGKGCCGSGAPKLPKRPTKKSSKTGGRTKKVLSPDQKKEMIEKMARVRSFKK